LTHACDTIVAEIQLLLTVREAPLVVALDGRSGAGKSNLAASIAVAVGGAVIDADDFFTNGPDAEWEARSTEAKVADALDWKRLRVEALEPLLAGEVASWHPFDFLSRVGLDSRLETCAPSAVIILDGAYCSRPELGDLINLSVLVEAPDDVRHQRLIAREGAEFMRAWHPIWDDAEEYYFTHVRPRESFDLIVTSDSDD
jgi:uridine kinase